MTIDVEQVWRDTWEQCVAKEMSGTQFDVAQWRVAGKTKALPDGQNLDYWAEEGLTQVQNYLDWFTKTGWKIATIGGEPAIELEVRAEFGGIEVLGYVDCVYETPSLLMVDFKTGAKTPESWIQMCLYAQGMERQYGVRPRMGAYYMTRKGALSTPEPLTRYHDGYFDSIFEQLQRGRENGPYLPNIGQTCRTCDVAYACYANSGPEAHLYDPDHPDFLKGRK